MNLRSTCAYCGVGCGIEVNVDKEGVSLRGDTTHPANYGKLCIKGSTLAETLGNQDRLTHPIINGVRGNWSEALDSIATKINQTIEQHGPDAVALYLSGQLLTEDYYVANKLMKGFIGSANVDTNSRLCMASTVVGHKRAFGEDIVPGCYEDLELADLIIFVGSNAAWNHPVIYQRISDAKQRNPKMKVVLVDPRRTATADLADLHLQINPGSDALLFNQLLRAIAESEALNPEYIGDYTQGFGAALAAAKQDTADDTSTLHRLGIDATELEAFVELFISTEKSVTLFSQGINQSSSGSDKVNAIINCHLATGRIGRPGMGPFSLTGQPNAMGGREVGGLANQLAAHEDFADPDGLARVEEFWKAPRLARKEGKKAVDMFAALESGEIKVIWIMGTNPVVSMPDANQVKRALAKAEMVIVSEAMSATDTLSFADIALPASTWSEKQGTVTNSDRLMSRQRGFIPPPGEAQHDWWAICEVAKRLGFSDAFNFNSPVEIFREHARLSGFKNGGRRLFDISALANISDEQYERFPPIRWPVTDSAPEGTARLFAAGGYTTPEGRARFLPITAKEPRQQPDDTQFVLNTGRLRDQWHTMTRTGRAARLWQHRQEPFVEISPADAQRLGLENSMLVRVQHRNQGETLVRVRVEPGQRDGELFAPMHWTAQFSSNARVNQLIESVTDPFSGQPELKQGRVTLEPIATDTEYAYLLTDRPIEQSELTQLTYWSHSLVAQGHLYALAAPTGETDWQALFYRVTEQEPNLIAIGRNTSALRAATVLNQRLTGYLYLNKTHRPPELSWVSSKIGTTLTTQERQRLLSLKAPSGVDTGRVICSCFQVRDSQLEEAVTEGAKTLKDLQKQLRCGTNCGSCIPELKAFLPTNLALEAGQ